MPGRAGTTIRTQGTVSGIIKTALVAPRSKFEGAAAVRQLAEDMRQNGQREGGVSRGDLKLMGWSTSQLDMYGDLAAIRAQTLSGASV